MSWPLIIYSKEESKTDEKEECENTDRSFPNSICPRSNIWQEWAPLRTIWHFHTTFENEGFPNHFDQYALRVLTVQFFTRKPQTSSGTGRLEWNASPADVRRLAWASSSLCCSHRVAAICSCMHYFLAAELETNTAENDYL